MYIWFVFWIQFSSYVIIGLDEPFLIFLSRITQSKIALAQNEVRQCQQYKEIACSLYNVVGKTNSNYPLVTAHTSDCNWLSNYYLGPLTSMVWFPTLSIIQSIILINPGPVWSVVQVQSLLRTEITQASWDDLVFGSPTTTRGSVKEKNKKMVDDQLGLQSLIYLLTVTFLYS